MWSVQSSLRVPHTWCSTVPEFVSLNFFFFFGLHFGCCQKIKPDIFDPYGILTCSLWTRVHGAPAQYFYPLTTMIMHDRIHRRKWRNVMDIWTVIAKMSRSELLIKMQQWRKEKKNTHIGNDVSFTFSYTLNSWSPKSSQSCHHSVNFRISSLWLVWNLDIMIAVQLSPPVTMLHLCAAAAL